MSVSGSSFASAGKKTGVGAASRAAGPGLALRRAMMLGLLIASFAASERAQADCNPPTADDNVTRHLHRHDQRRSLRLWHRQRKKT